VLRGLSGTKRESLILKGFLRYSQQHEFNENRTVILLKSLAIPAGFELATHGVEIRYWNLADPSLGAGGGPAANQNREFLNVQCRKSLLP
jgi:hypothetical protein